MVCAYPDGPTKERALCFGDGREEFKMDIRMQTSPAMQDEFQECGPRTSIISIEDTDSWTPPLRVYRQVRLLVKGGGLLCKPGSSLCQ